MSSPPADDEPVDAEPSTDPIRVAEVTLAIYQWDGWVSAASAAHRRARFVATVTGATLAILAAGCGVAYIPGAGRFSAVVYAPIIGWGVRQWLIAQVSERRMRPILAELRNVVVPALVVRIDDSELRRLVTHGGVLLSGLSTIIESDRRESAVVLEASEYDLNGFPYFQGGVGGP